MNRPGSVTGRRGGFALAMVVFLLFAVAVAGATAYSVVRLEAEMAIGSEEGNDALDVAHAGLQRYLAESLGPPDSITYPVGGGSATVTPRKVGRIDAETDLYLLRSTGIVSDARYPDAPARRVVSQYAYLHRQPVADTAAMVVAYGGTVAVRDDLGGTDLVEVDGNDHADHGSGACAAVSSRDLLGIIKTGTSAPTPSHRIDGQPSDYQLLTTRAAVNAANGLRWDILQNPGQPVGPWDGYRPTNVFANHPDSFPVVRVAGDLMAYPSHSGRGVLIVPGTLNIYYGFHWDGIILAGSIGVHMSPFDVPSYHSTIDGVLVGGLDGGSETDGVEIQNMWIRYNRCYAWFANQNIAYLEPLDATWWEGV